MSKKKQCGERSKRTGKHASRLAQARSAAVLLAPGPEWDIAQQCYERLTEEEVIKRSQDMNKLDTDITQARELAKGNNLFGSREERLAKKFAELKEWENKLRLCQIDVDQRFAEVNGKKIVLKKSEDLVVKEKDKLMVERQKLDAMRRQLTMHQGEVSAKISELAEETTKRAKLILENNKRVENMEVVVKRMTEERDAAVFECKQALDRAATAESKAKLSEEKESRALLKYQESTDKLKNAERFLNDVTIREKQLQKSIFEHESLVEDFTERKKELTTQEAAMDTRKKTLKQKEDNIMSSVNAHAKQLDDYKEKEKELEKLKKNFQELTDVIKTERLVLNKRRDDFQREHSKLDVLRKGIGARTVDVEEREKALKKLLEDAELKQRLARNIKSEWEDKIIAIEAREQVCKEAEIALESNKKQLEETRLNLENERKRLKILDRHLQQFGEDCETQREINEQESKRLAEEWVVFNETNGTNP